MTRRVPRLLPAAGLALAVALVALPAWAVAHRPDPGPVYAVTQLVDSALRHPKDWNGRTVRVHANASVSLLTVFQGGAPHTRAALQTLLLPAPDPRHPLVAQDGTIRVLAGREDGVLALLRRVPLLGSVASPPQRVSMTQAGIYRIQIQPTSQGCNFSPCIEAVLVDASPVADPTTGLLPGT